MKWKLKTIGDLLTESVVPAVAPSPERRIRVYLNAEGVEKRPLLAETEGATRYFRRSAGQFIYGKQNLHKGAFGVVPVELDGFESSSDLPAFDVAAECRPMWLEYFLKQGAHYKSLVSIARGAATKRIQPSALFSVEIPVPPIEVQDEIIGRMNSCSSEHKKLEHEITHQEALLAKLKQAILQEAIAGKLTADWRAAHADVEPASELLHRIQAERARLIAAKKLRPEKPLPKITPAEIPFEIPQGWEWCRLGTIANEITKGSSPTWQGVRYVENAESGILFVTSKNVGSGEMIFDKETFVEARFNEIEPRSILEKNDILTNLVGASIARTALFEFECVANINQAVGLIRIADGYINKPLLVAYMNSAAGVAYMLEKQFAPGRANLSLADMGKMLVPLPPLAEQAAIVARVEALMEHCRALAAEIAHTRTHAAHLLQAVLKEAFAPAA